MIRRTAEDMHSSYTQTTVIRNEAKQWLKPEMKKDDLPGLNYDTTQKQDDSTKVKECEK
jgi:hypothetical protein